MIGNMLKNCLIHSTDPNKRPAIYHKTMERDELGEPNVAPTTCNRDLKHTLACKEWGWLNVPNDNITLLDFLDRFANHSSVTICELGVAYGKTANRLVEYLKCLQIPTVYYFGIDDLSLLKNPPVFDYPEMVFVNGNRDKISGLPKLDFAFIDACHCAECVFRDATTVSKNVAVGGYMGFHDTSIQGQYPFSRKSKLHGQRQHYGRKGETARPLSVLEGITAGRAKWEGEWDLVIQTGDDLDWGGIRIYQKIQ